MKLAFVIQRYGRDIVGGSETLARQIAERLSRRHEITGIDDDGTGPSHLEERVSGRGFEAPRRHRSTFSGDRRARSGRFQRVLGDDLSR